MEMRPMKYLEHYRLWKLLCVATVPAGFMVPDAVISLVRLWDWRHGDDDVFKYGLVVRFKWPFRRTHDRPRSLVYPKRWRLHPCAVVVSVDGGTLILRAAAWSEFPT